jgi:hypothetical protein
MLLLKKATAASILVGPVLDSSGLVYTGMTISDFNITKNGTTAAMAAAATATHDHNGMYLIALTTGNTDTLGRLTISCNKATYAMSAFGYEVLTALTFDAIVTNGAGVANGLPILDVNQYVGANIRQVIGQDVGSDGQGSLYTIPVTADGNATPLGLTVARVTKLDNLDAAITTRMATFTLPTNFSSFSIDSSGLVGLFASQSFNNSGQSTALPANVTKWLSQTPRALK